MAKSKPLDVKTQTDLFVPPKRGRGRPKKEGALTNAERQARWRQNAVTVKASVLEAAIGSVDHLGLVEENRALRRRVAELEAALSKRNVTKRKTT